MIQSKSRRGLQKIVLGFICLMQTQLIMAQTSPGLGWKMAFRKWTGTEYEEQPMIKPIKLADGNEFQLFFQLNEPAYVYMVFQSASGKLTPLVSSAIEAGIPRYLPAMDDSFPIAPPAGTEKLHVVVSRGQQLKLEKLLESLAKNPEDQKVGQALLGEIAAIKQGLTTLNDDPGKPSPIGGVRRGSKPINATEFQGMNTYVKTIRIEH